MLSERGRTTLVTQFHVSPTLRCRASNRIGVEQSTRPADSNTRNVDVARNAVIVSQIMGKATPGGVHDGRIVSLGVATRFPSTSKPPRGGRFADSIEKMRDLRERNANSGGTNGAGKFPTASMALNNVAMRPNCTAVAAGYFAVCTQSTCIRAGVRVTIGREAARLRAAGEDTASALV